MHYSASSTGGDRKSDNVALNLVPLDKLLEGTALCRKRWRHPGPILYCGVLRDEPIGRNPAAEAVMRQSKVCSPAKGHGASAATADARTPTG